jgi:hypothetical protein
MMELKCAISVLSGVQIAFSTFPVEIFPSQQSGPMPCLSWSCRRNKKGEFMISLAEPPLLH